MCPGAVSTAVAPCPVAGLQFSSLPHHPLFRGLAECMPPLLGGHGGAHLQSHHAEAKALRVTQRGFLSEEKVAISSERACI